LSTPQFLELNLFDEISLLAVVDQSGFAASGGVV
jgi:hypothetical protein